jgi:hypothetical protein
MKRRNTIDSFHGTTWPLCQYYYTHNTGSCDDVLLLDKRKTTLNNSKQRKAVMPTIRKKRRYTYPIVLLDQQAYEQQFREINNLTTTPGLILRRWSTIRKHKKRRTLADIISNLTTQHEVSESSHIVDNNTDKEDVMKSMMLEERWDSIRKYKEKTQQEAITTMQLKTGTSLLKVKNEDEKTAEEPSPVTAEPSLVIDIPAQQPITGSTTENTTLMDSGININSSLLAHPPSSNSTSAGQMEHTDINQCEDRYSSSISEVEEQSIRVPMPYKNDSKEQDSTTTDMFLFLFGFILFPLWWIGSWRYFTRHHRDRKREVFQILNCYMSLASLLLTGLIIGLTTVWA